MNSEPRDRQPVFIVMLVIVGVVALTCVGGGILAIIFGSNADSAIELFGQRLRTAHVGVAFVFLGVVSMAYIFRAAVRVWENTDAVGHTDSTTGKTDGDPLNLTRPSQSPANVSSPPMSDVGAAVASMLAGRRHPRKPWPTDDVVRGYMEEPISTGGSLKADNVEEAWVMAFIEKHMGDFELDGRAIWEYGDRNGKRDAGIRLAKARGYVSILNEIAPRS